MKIEKLLTKLLWGVLTFGLLVVLPYLLFGIDLFKDVHFNRPLKHLEEDIIGFLTILGSWWLYWEIIDALTKENK